MKFEAEMITLTPLQKALANLEAQNIALGKARNDYLLKESLRKHHEAKLVSGMVGRSHAERLMQAQALPQWVSFQRDLAKLESLYEFQKLKFEILEKSWQSCYLETKLDQGLIIKQE